MTTPSELLALADRVDAWEPSKGVLVFIALERRRIADALRQAAQRGDYAERRESIRSVLFRTVPGITRRCNASVLECAVAAIAALPVAEARSTVPDGWKLVPIEPPESMWGGLARQIIMWDRFDRPTEAALLRHLKASGFEIPTWLAAECRDIDHVPPKGTVAVWVYRAMLDAAPNAPTEATTKSDGSYVARSAGNPAGLDPLKRTVGGRINNHQSGEAGLAPGPSDHTIATTIPDWAENPSTAPRPTVRRGATQAEGGS